MATDYIYDPRARRLLGLPPLGGAMGQPRRPAPPAVGMPLDPARAAGARFDAFGAQDPIPPSVRAMLDPNTPGLPPAPLSLGGAAAQRALADLGGGGAPSYTNADLPPAEPALGDQARAMGMIEGELPAPPPPDPAMGGAMNAFSPEGLDPLGMAKARQAPTSLDVAAAPPSAGGLSMGSSPIRGVFPGAGTFGIVQPTDTRGEEIGRSTAGTPAAASKVGLPGLLARSNELEVPAAPSGDSWMARQYGLPGMLNTVGDYERQAITAGQEATTGARGMLRGAGRAIGNWFAGRPQEAVAASMPPPPSTVNTTLPSGQGVVRAGGPTGPPKAAPGSIDEAVRNTGRNPRPQSREQQGPPAELAGVPSYTNADLDAVRERGPQRGGFVFGSEESLPIEERLDRAIAKRALTDVQAAGGTGLMPSQQRQLEYKRQEGEIRFAAMDKLIDEDAERTIAEGRSMPSVDPAKLRAFIDDVRAEALEKKLWNRRLGVAGWPRSGVDSYDPATGAPLYAPPAQ